MTNQNVQTNRHGPQNKGCNQASADSKHYLVSMLRPQKQKKLEMCQYYTDAPAQGHPHPYAGILQKKKKKKKKRWKKGHNSHNN